MPQNYETFSCYIKKNKAIPALLACYQSAKGKADNELTGDERRLLKNVNCLRSAIEHGRYSDLIFQDKDCHLYWHCLMNTPDFSVEFDRCLTVYLFFIVKWQNNWARKTFKLSRPESIKLRDTHVLTCCDSKGELTDVGFQFLEGVHENMRAHGVDTRLLLENDFKRIVSSIDPADRIVISFDLSYLCRRAHRTELLVTLLSGMLFSRRSQQSFKKIYLPSLALFKKLLIYLYKTPLLPTFFLGKVGEETLRKLHGEGVHPVACFSPLVRDNQIAFHGYNEGPLPVLLHDLYHVVKGSILSREDRGVLFHETIPSLIAHCDAVEAQGPEFFRCIQPFKKLIRLLSDIEPEDYLLDRKLESFLVSWLRRAGCYPAFNEGIRYKFLGEYAPDHLFFLLHRNFPDKTRVGRAVRRISGGGFTRGSQFVLAIRKLASLSPTSPVIRGDDSLRSYGGVDLNWALLLSCVKVAESDPRPNQKLFELMKDPSSLLTETDSDIVSLSFFYRELILEYDFRFFPPHLVLSTEDFGVLKQFFEKKVAQKNQEEREVAAMPGTFYYGATRFFQYADNRGGVENRSPTPFQGLGTPLAIDVSLGVIEPEEKQEVGDHGSPPLKR